MEINPQEVIKHLSNEISRLNLELAFVKAALSQQEVINATEEEAG